MQDRQMSFIGHLDELRSRLIFVLLSTAILSIGSYFFADQIIGFLGKPTGGFVFLRPTEAFFVRLKISLIVGVLLAIPIMIYEIWRFIGAGLTPSEKRSMLAMLPVSYALFCVGAACAWFMVLPMAIHFLLGFASGDLRPMLSIDAYVSFAAWLTVAFGAMFQMPVIVYFLVKMGIVTPATLLFYRRHVILGLAVAAAFLTPGPDLFSFVMLLIPTYLLYEISIWIAKWTNRE